MRQVVLHTNANVSGSKLDADIDTTKGLKFGTASPATDAKIEVSLKTDGGLQFESDGSLSVNMGASAINGVLPPSKGGTGSSTAPLNGQVPIGSSGNYVPAFLTAGTGVE